MLSRHAFSENIKALKGRQALTRNAGILNKKSLVESSQFEILEIPKKQLIREEKTIAWKSLKPYHFGFLVLRNTFLNKGFISLKRFFRFFNNFAIVFFQGYFKKCYTEFQPVSDLLR